jgi:ABC-type multidrug transport system ATPase subunit
MIEIKNLHKTYGSGVKAVQALKGIDLVIGEGMYGLLGPNGAGKTTLIRILAGIVQATEGDVLVAGVDLRTEKNRRQMKAMLGYLPQELGLYPDLTGRQFIDYIAILKGLDDNRARKRRVEEVLEMVSLTKVAGRKIKGYSGGMKRRVGIAQALVNNPRILIVDEPTAGLDPEERIRFRNLLVDLAADRTVLLSTHIVGDIGQTCRSMTVLAEGEIRFQGTPLELTQMAEGHVWTISCADGSKPNHGLMVISTQHMPEGVRYRVVGEEVSEYPEAVAESPSLEDGYVWLMNRQKTHNQQGRVLGPQSGR